jgi:hypothetical protein
MADGAVPDFGEILSQVAFLLAAQLRVPPPVLLMYRYPVDPQVRLIPEAG